LDEVPDASLTALHIVAPSLPNTLKDNTALFMTFFDPPFPLTQSTEFEIGETFGVGANVHDNDICCESGDVFIEAQALYETSMGTSCVDFMVARPASPDLVDNISPNALDTFHAFSLCSVLATLPCP